jgi:hypothetical protein
MWMMLMQEILAAMKSGKSEGKVHYVRIVVSTALWGIMDLRVLRWVIGLLIPTFQKNVPPYLQGSRS